MTRIPRDTSMRRRHLLALLAALPVARAAFAVDADTGFVLLHGKQSRAGEPAEVASRLKAAGLLVATPEMPWSQRREYDVPYADALEEAAAAAKELQARGAKRVVVGGHSLGANAALAYAASGRPLAGVVALSPGHAPDAPGFRRGVAPGLQKAQEMVARGAGEEKAWFPDSNQGRSRQVRTTAAAYLSYFDPQGLGSMVKSCRAIPAGVPLFMSVGEPEGILAYARDTLFTAAPKHPKSVFLVVPGDHLGAPRASADRLVQWVEALGTTS